jgi:hypothetical protein
MASVPILVSWRPSMISWPAVRPAGSSGWSRPGDLISLTIHRCRCIGNDNTAADQEREAITRTREWITAT